MQLSFKYILTISLSIVVLSILMLISIVGAIRDAREIRILREQYQRTSFDLFLTSIREPLIQGSFAEVNQRTASILDNEHSHCIEVVYYGSTIVPCSKNVPVTDYLLTLNQEISFDQNNNRAPVAFVRMVFNNSDIEASIRKTVLLDLSINSAISLFVFVLSLVGFRFITNELNHVLDGCSLNSDTSKSRERIRIKEFRFLFDELQKYIAETKKSTELRAFIEVATQVSHDIRSPLSALNMVSSSAQNLSPESKRILSAATERINDIANDLLRRAKTDKLIGSSNPAMPAIEVACDTQYPDSVDVFTILNSIVDEKRTLLTDGDHIEFRLSKDREGPIFARGSKTDLLRILSNLINNSIESLSHGGAIDLGVRESKNDVVLIIADNGCGMPGHILRQIGEPGLTYGKSGTESGSGLGLYHAKKTIEASGGRFRVQSKVGQGTIITLVLPKANFPLNKSS